MFSAPSQKRYSQKGTVAALHQIRAVHYSGIELLLIGFASALITFLWVGVFSSFLSHSSFSSPASGAELFSATVRGVSQEVHIASVGVLEASHLIVDTVSYQFTAMWESSCITQQVCTMGLARVENGVESVASSFAGISEHSHRVVAIARDLTSLRFLDFKRHVALLLMPQSAYAADVLGEKTISRDELLKNAATGYFQFVDSMSFGAVSALDPELLGKNEEHVPGSSLRPAQN